MDQPKNVPGAPQGAKPDDLVYNVMPQDGKSFSSSFQASNPPAQNSPHAPSPQFQSSSSGSKKWIYIIIGIVVLLALGGLAYYLLGTKKPATVEAPTTKLPKAWLVQYFNADTCSDQTTCGDDVDPDNDGLSNYSEFKAGTNPLNPDTDTDGLADGDETNIYKTDPTLKYTDRREVVAQNDWTDGFQIKGGYDPLTPGIKFTDARKQQISNDTITFHLHEPSITTTTIVTPPPNDQTGKQTINVSIQNNAFNPPSVTLKSGDTIVWTNKDTVAHHVASDPHPSHTGLPGLESPDLATNQSYSFTFTKTGTFGYHDHLHSTIKATVTVK